MSPYERPLLYDIAFSWRDFPAEVAALCRLHARHGGGPPRTFLELGAGPADHAIGMALGGCSSTALDRSAAMCAYARQKSALMGASLEVVEADLRGFELAARFDLALLANNTLAHLHDLDALVGHLQAVARHLEPGGLYVIEAQHPSHFVGRAGRSLAALHPWALSRYGIEVRTTWGHPDDPYDPLRQIFEARVEMQVEGPEGATTLVERVPMRDWTCTELQAAVRLADGLELLELRGELAADVPLQAGSPRLVAVLRKAA